jgi:uncharacterized membrane protein
MQFGTIEFKRIIFGVIMEHAIPHLSSLIAIQWLKKGWQDMAATGWRGCFYGAVFALMGYFISFIYGNLWQATMGVTAGFFLMGPFVCCGIYELSRQHERGEDISLFKSFFAFKRNWKAVAFFAVLLTFMMIVWARVSIVTFALFAEHSYPTVQAMFEQIFALQNIEFLLVWTMVGFVFASLVFSIALVTVPTLIDQDTDLFTAAFASANALWTHTLTCFVWAVLIVLIIGASLLVFNPLLIITAPLIGHATWHAYKSLVTPIEHEQHAPCPS